MMLMEDLPNESVAYSVCNSQFFKSKKDLSDQIPFLFQNSNISLSFSFFDRDRQPMMYTICVTQRLISTTEALKKRAPDLVLFSRYSLFGPLCSFSFFKFCLHLGAYD